MEGENFVRVCVYIVAAAFITAFTVTFFGVSIVVAIKIVRETGIALGVNI